MNKYIAIFALVVIAFSACKKPSGSKIPQIADLVIFPNQVRAGSSADTLILRFKLVDQDGDIGHETSSGIYDVYLRDTRTDKVIGYFLPEIPDDFKDAKNGIEGTCTIIINAGFLQLRPDHPELDTLQFDVHVKDIAGNESNKILTEKIYLVKP